MPTGVKYDEGKAPLFQGCIDYFARALKAVANISRYGKEKYANEYADKGWESVPDGYKRYTDGDARHLADEAVDGLYDPESDYLHAAHHAWNALARLELLLKDGTPLRNPSLEEPYNPTMNFRPGQHLTVEPEPLDIDHAMRSPVYANCGDEVREHVNTHGAQAYTNEISKRLSK